MGGITTWSPILIALIPAILGSGAVFSTIGTYFSEVRDDPIVRLNLHPGYGRGSAEISNTGGGPATNLTSVITVPYPLTTIRNFSLETMSLTNESKTIYVSIPKLTQGQGALANISFDMSGQQVYTENYSGYVLYDQGSASGTIVNPFDRPIVNFFENLADWLINTPIGIGIFFTLMGLSLYFLYLGLKRWTASHGYRKSTDHATYDLAEIYGKYAKENIVARRKGRWTASLFGISATDEIAVTLMRLESIARDYQDKVEKFQRRNPNVGDGKKVKRHHEVHFDSILDNETDELKTAKKLDNFLDSLQREIVKIWMGEEGGARYRPEAYTNLSERIEYFREYWVIEQVSPPPASEAPKQVSPPPASEAPKQGGAPIQTKKEHSNNNDNKEPN